MVGNREHVKLTDGGRLAAGFTGIAGDCVTRAIAIAAGRPYELAYTELRRRQQSYASERDLPRRWRSPRTGVFHDVWIPYLFALGWRQVLPLPADLPMGRLIVELPEHLTAVIDGVTHDAFDPWRTRRRVRSIWTGPLNDNPLDRPVALQLFTGW